MFDDDNNTLAHLLGSFLHSSLNGFSIISPQDDNFAMEVGRQPITFENPLYATAPAASGDPAVIHATQVVNPVLFLWTLFADVTTTCIFGDGLLNI